MIEAQYVGYELVDLATGLPAHASDDGSRRDLCGAEGVVHDRIKETVEQRDVVLDRLAVRIHFNDGDVLPQHRVAEAVDDVRELGCDAWVDVR